MKYGFRTYKQFCPFCNKLNISPDATWRDDSGDELTFCNHFFQVVAAGRGKEEFIFRDGLQQKGGCDVQAYGPTAKTAEEVDRQALIRRIDERLK